MKPLRGGDGAVRLGQRIPITARNDKHHDSNGVPELEAAVSPDYPSRGCPRRARSNQVPQAVAKLPSRVVGNCSVPAVASEQILHSFHEILAINALGLAATTFNAA